MGSSSCGLFQLLVLATAAFSAPVSARAVNISNTWMLPEEGFPVFYRYFHDRISWYEADAVCQFHHANLVTADSSSQYDAIRAYLKELDIAENVWIGLSKASEKPNFTWTDFRPLSSEGHWQQAIPQMNDSLCVALDPAADFLWKPLKCGGPEVASFICELPVPSWALGPQGCMLTELPSLTVLYIPDQLALELTSDCGLDGTKRIACKGNADREEILKQLTCAITPDDFEDKSTTKQPAAAAAGFQSSTTADSNADLQDTAKTTKPWLWTSNTIDIDYGMPTRHRRETEDTLSPLSTTRSSLELRKSPVPESTTTVTIKDDVTLDSSIASSSSSRTPEDATQEPADVAEYPSAISQGQLFSIIENGTMFDIIELNDTTSLEPKAAAKDTKLEPLRELPDAVQKTPLITAPSTTAENLYTTVVYHKEPPSEANFVTNRSIKKSPKKQIYKKDKPEASKIAVKTARNSTKESANFENDDKSVSMLNKEIEMFPIIKDSNIILNRTHRKEVPVDEGLEMENLDAGSRFGNARPLNFTTDNKLAEIFNKQMESAKNEPTAAAFLTTEKTSTTSQKLPEEFMLMKTQFLPKSLLGEIKQSGEGNDLPVSSQDPLEPEPEAQPRPNRQRQLTRPQRRSFYPYFFSRVLG